MSSCKPQVASKLLKTRNGQCNALYICANNACSRLKPCVTSSLFFFKECVTISRCKAHNLFFDLTL